MSKDKLKEEVLLYLYGELSEEDKLSFEEDLAKYDNLRKIYEAEKKNHEFFSLSTEKEISDSLLQDSRSELRRRLKEENNSSLTDSSASGGLLHLLFGSPSKIVAALSMLTFGILLGKFVSIQIDFDNGIEVHQLTSSIEGIISNELLGSADMEIADMKIVAYDAESQEITLSIDAVTSVAIRGNISNHKIQTILAAALQSDLGPSIRLKSVDLLQMNIGNIEIVNALIYALKNDDNPGVRLKAVEALGPYSDNSDVKEALLNTLKFDQNAGVRIQAILALKDNKDPKVLEVLKQKMESDENEYIRDQSRESVSDWTINKTGREI
ncbi:HEAT repeat domain-containing protein [Candidatus Marinimicrobia bacterium MT.SAG.4]|nr:HEAT repeat domain-containing protein [Candidatus Marinimicrobia bacterium MT.SAG.4]